MQATISSKGQVTLPKKVHDQLHLKPGDKFEFLTDDDGSVRVIPITMPVSKLKGMVPKPKRVVSLAEMDEAITKEAAKR